MVLNGNECVANCENKKVMEDNSSKCYDTCPENTLLLSDNNKCHAGDSCPEGYDKVENENICNKKEDPCKDKPYMSASDPSECVADCNGNVWY